MSLINDALKKAQNGDNRQRAETMLGGNGHAGHREQSGPFRMILIIVLAIGFAGWGVALIFIFMKKDASQEVAAVNTAEVVQATELEQYKEVPVVAETAKPVVEESIPAQPVVSQPAVKTELPVVVEQVPEPAKVETIAPTIQFNEPEEEPELNTDNIKIILMLDISAVMGDGKKCRIIVGGRVVRVGQLIDYEKDIRFMGKKDSILYFKDSTGQTYEKDLL